jgi:drug/metabolite transporter (DMT)-like permease
VALRAGVDPVTLATVRVTGALVILVLVAALFRPEALRPPGGRLGLLIVLHGLVGVAGLQWTYFVAIDRLPVGMALLLEYQAPILVAVWARVVQREPVRNRMWLGLALAMLGLAAATGIWKGAVFDPIGIAAGFGAAICFAAYFLIGEHGVGLLDPLRVILWSFFVAAVGLNLFSPITSLSPDLLTAQAPMLGILEGYDAPVWALLAWITILGTLVPFAFELSALRHLPATTVTMIAMLEPVGVSALGWVWFFERLDAIAIAGGIAVVVGIVLAQTARREHVLIEPPHP